MNCQYCNNTLADLKSLIKHQKQTKYCLEKQKENSLIEEKDNEINLLKTQLNEKDNEINLLKTQLNSLKYNESSVKQKFDFHEIQEIIKEYCKY
jgi:predicted RNase H-like nuclease (RuvC/YqgF family)